MLLINLHWSHSLKYFYQVIEAIFEGSCCGSSLPSGYSSEELMSSKRKLSVLMQRPKSSNIINFHILPRSGIELMKFNG